MPKFRLLVLMGTLALACTHARALPHLNQVKKDSSSAISVSPRSNYGEMTFSDTTDASNNHVVVDWEVLAGWRFLYKFVTESEFVLCLEGERDALGRVHITGFRLALMTETTISSVRYRLCKGMNNYIGTAHNHPPVSPKNLCYQSAPDIKSYMDDTRAKIDIVLCGDNKFLWVTPT
jgi:hypothetical protein